MTIRTKTNYRGMVITPGMAYLYKQLAEWDNSNKERQSWERKRSVNELPQIQQDIIKSVALPLDSKWLLELLARYLGITGDLSDLKDNALRIALKEGFNRVVMTDSKVKSTSKAMKKAGKTVEAVGLTEVIREITFKTWKLMIRSGDVSDQMRDSQAGPDKDHPGEVVNMVNEAGITDESKMQEIVKATMVAVRDLTF